MGRASGVRLTIASAAAAFAAVVLVSITVSAQQGGSAEISGGDALQSKLEEVLRAATQGQVGVTGLAATPVEGIVEVELSSGEVLYSSDDGNFLLSGDMLQTTPQGLVNLTAQKRQVKVREWIAEVPEDEMVIFSPGDEGAQTQGTITVFTDVDCTYCRRLHGDIEELLSRGIRVRYVAYPRGGQQSEALPKMVSVWCSENRQRSLTQAKNGQDLPTRECENPVMEHYELGNRIGISGTPAIVLNDGQVIPGYVGVDQLEAMVTRSR